MALAIATTVLYPGVAFSTWVRFHLRRCSMILLYLDDPEQRATFQSLCEGLKVYIFDGAQDAPGMSRPNRILLRQDKNIKDAITYLLQQDHEKKGLGAVEWLLHIDQDELLYEGEGEGNYWRTDASLGQVTFTNHEAVPLMHDTENPFRDCVWFNANGPDAEPFMAYGNGKSAVRLSRGVEPDGPHQFKNFRGKSTTLPGGQMGDGGILDPVPVVLHYPYPSFELWLAKFRLYGAFSDYWLDDESCPNRLEFMLRSRDVVGASVVAAAAAAAHSPVGLDDPWREARDFFATRAFTGDELQSRIRDGRVLHYTPIGCEL
ncbi:hypothetical protein F5Y10DRAFT_149192 [Nemania abortiva]|nr:hypothetical protein F5Y10DRAFT_149192 [Nemania abortiva]